MMIAVIYKASDYGAKDKLIIKFKSVKSILDFIQENGRIIIQEADDFIKNAYPGCTHQVTIYDDWMER